MADHDSPGEKTASRLLSRAARGLQRKDVGTGDTNDAVYSGPLASKALRAMGARAMTLDEKVIVDEDFDPNTKAEDAALYAHERVHVEGSGGEGAIGARDSEEISARAVESMVLHRSRAGESFGAIVRDMKDNGSAAVHRSAAPTVSRAGNSGGGGSGRGSGGMSGAPPRPDEVKAAYSAALGQGKSHEMIVRDLARYVIDAMSTSEEYTKFRVAPAKSL